MDESPANQPERYRELVKVHGRLDPLVNINMKPDTHVKVEVLQMSLDLLLFCYLKIFRIRQSFKLAKNIHLRHECKLA